MKFKSLILMLSLITTLNFYSQECYVASKSGLNVRENPNLKSNKIGTIIHKQKVNILEKTTITLKIINNGKELTGNWVKIKSNNIEGYVFDGFLEFTTKIDNEFLDFLGKDIWTSIYKIENKWVNYVNCIVGNPGFKIKGTNFDEYLEMDMAYWKILSISKIDNNVYKLNIEMYGFDGMTGHKKIYNFEIINPNEKIIISLDDKGNEIDRYVTESNLKNYEILRDECEKE